MHALQKSITEKTETLYKVLKETPCEKDSKVTLENLESINLTDNKVLCYFKELIGEPFIEYHFFRMSLPGVVAWVRDELSPNGTWLDDSSMALATLDSIQENREVNYTDECA